MRAMSRVPLVAAAGLLALAWLGCSVDGPTTDPDGDFEVDGDAPEEVLPPAETWLWMHYPTGGRGYGNAIAEAPNGDVVVAGFVDGDGGAWLTRIDPDGEIVWDRATSGWITALLPHPDGGYLIGGTRFGVGAWLAYVDENGSAAWKVLLADDGGGERIEALAPITGGFLAGGSVTEPSAGRTTAWMARLDLGGNPLWQQRIDGMTGVARGGIVAAADGSVLVAARDGETISGSAPSAWVARFDGDGRPLWQRRLAGPVASNEGPGVAGTASGDVVVVYGSTGGMRVIRLSAEGSARWEALVGGVPDVRGALAIPGPNDGVIVAGMQDGFVETSFDLWLFGLDAEGRLLWQTTLPNGQPETAHGLVATGDGGFLALSGGCCGSWIAKLRSDGSFGGACGDFLATTGTVTMVAPTVEPDDLALPPTTLVPSRSVEETGPHESALEVRCPRSR